MTFSASGRMLNPKTAWEGGSGEGGVNLTHPCGFSKKCIFHREGETLVFCEIYIILRYIFSENFIEFPQVVQKILTNSLSILANFDQFSSIFWIF